MVFHFNKNVPDIELSMYGASLERVNVKLNSLVFWDEISVSLDYGSFIFGSAAKSLLEKLDSIESRDLRIYCGAFNEQIFTDFY